LQANLETETYAMSLTRWLSNRLGLSSRPVSRRKPSARRRTVRPTLEALEDRWVPSTLTVRNNLDSGAGSLRAEIAAAQKNDTIVFAPSLNGQTITLTSGEVLINKNLTIAGPGAGELTVSGNNASRVFEVAKGKQVALSGLTVSNGKAAEAGGILNHGTLTLSGDTLSGNSAAGSGAGEGVGGGIQNFGTLTVSGTTLSGNSATNGGGAIANDGTLTLSNSTLSNNTAIDGGGGINNGGMATISGSTLTGNVAAYGGGIINAGTLTLTDSILSGNHANNSGGGIDNFGALTVTGSTLSGNSAYYGGGIYTALGFGGNTAMLTNTTLTGNTAVVAGGGIYVTGGTLTLSGSTLSGNFVTGSFLGNSNGGGGIFNGAAGTVIVKNFSKITGNTASVGHGADAENQGVLDLDSSSIIAIFDGNAAVPI
jgi:predicted outer membrane repeat protein